MRSKLGLLDVAAPPRPEEISFGGVDVRATMLLWGAPSPTETCSAAVGAVPKLRDPIRRLFQVPRCCGGAITVVRPYELGKRNRLQFGPFLGLRCNNGRWALYLLLNSTERGPGSFDAGRAAIMGTSVKTTTGQICSTSPAPNTRDKMPKPKQKPPSHHR